VSGGVGGKGGGGGQEGGREREWRMPLSQALIVTSIDNLYHWTNVICAPQGCGIKDKGIMSLKTLCNHKVLVSGEIYCCSFRAAFGFSEGLGTSLHLQASFVSF
jgi:hypothetical protein